MAITRQNIADYLDEQFHSLAVAVGQDATPLTGYAPDIDNALRKLGKTESELAAATVDDTSRDVVFALAEYYAARRIWRLLGDRVNHTMNESKFDFADQRANVRRMMELAADLCAQFGYSVDGRQLRTATFKVY